MKAIILSAGKGERLRPLTATIPKPMIPIAGKPVLEYLIRLCRKHDIKDIAINTSYLPEKIKEYFNDGKEFGVNIKYSFEKELLGTSGALNNFRDFFKKETFFVIYGDNITDLNLTEMLKFHHSKRSIATLFLYKEKMIDEKTTMGSVVINSEGRIKQILENPSSEEKKTLESIPQEFKLINAGVYILEPEILDLIPQGFSDFAKEIFPEALKLGKRIYGFQKECYFKEVGQMTRYSLAKEDLE
ncbi:MAG: nucleotidyltransferase family protein, partial [archaeon]